MKVLQLTTIRNSFFQEQTSSLEENGINCDVLAASDWRQQKDWKDNSRNTIREKLWDKFEFRFGGFNPVYYSVVSARYYPLILKQTLMKEYDLIHSNSGLVAPFATLQPKRPLVITFWGTFLDGGRLNGYSENIAKACSRRADAVIVRNKKMKKQIPGNAHIIPSGVDLEKFTPENKEDARSRLGWNQNECYVIFVNRPDKPVKRFKLAEAVANEADRNFNHPVNFEVVSGVPHEEVPAYYNAADAMILTSRSEGSPNVVKEAMACNCPVVTTDVGDVRERLKNVSPSKICTGKDELVDGLLSVLADGRRSNGREYAKEVSKKKMGEKIIEVYEDILS